MVKLPFFYLITFFFTITINSQTKVKVKGVIKEENGNPVPFANITFYTLEKKLRGGGISNDSGTFIIDDLPAGTYIMEISCIGYKKIADTISLKNKIEDIGVKVINPDPLVLKEIQVEAEKPIISIVAEKKVYNVANDPTAKGQTLKDLILKMPGVSVDEEGNISIRGEPVSKIYVNNKLSVFSRAPDQFLESVPADAVEKIEIITQKTAKYEAEGGGAILNIVLKGQNEMPLLLNLSGAAGYPLSYKLTPMFEVNKNRYSLSFMYSLNKNRWEGYITHTRYYPSGTSEQYTTFINDIYDHLMSFDGTYSIKKHRLSIGANMKVSNWYNTRNNTGKGILGNYDRPSLGSNYSFSIEPNASLFLTFSEKLSTEITVKGEYMKHDDKEDISEFNIYNGISSFSYTQSVHQKRDEREFRMDMNNTLKIHDSLQMEFGLSALSEKGDVDATVFITKDFGTYELFPYGTPSINITSQNFYSYVQMEHTLRYYFYKLGVRYENVLQKYHLQKDITAEYNNIFPSLILGTNLKKITIQGGYSMSIKRPDLHDLLYIYTFADKYNFFGSSRELKPYLIHSFEINIFPSSAKFAQSTIFYRSALDKIERVRTRKGDTLIMDRINVQKYNSAGIESALPIPLKFLTLIISFSVEREYYSHRDSLISFEITEWRVPLRFVFRTQEFNGWGAQGFSLFTPSSKVPYGKRIPFFWLDLGIYKKIGKRVKLTLSASDLFNTRRFGGDFDYGAFTVKSRFKPNTTSINFNVSVDLGQKPAKEKMFKRPSEQEIPMGM